MRTVILFFSCWLFCWLTTSIAAGQSGIPPMPAAVSGNAVASLRNGTELFSLMGVGPRKTWDDVTTQVYILHLAAGKWEEGRAVPGVVGRIAASAVGARSQVFLMGGYVVDSHGIAGILSDVNVYVPPSHRWYAGKEIPTAVSNAVVGVNHDRYIYLVGGLSKAGPVNLVQVYDAEINVWTEATPMPGPPVFGHAGGIIDDSIVYCDGATKGEAKNSLVASEGCWQGKIDRKDAMKIEWAKIASHPGDARFGIAAGSGEKDHRIFFTGGSAAPFDYRGIGMDGKPAEASSLSFAYDVRSGKWETLSEANPDSRLQASGVLGTPLGELILGGMAKGQAVTARVSVLPKK
jgi:N-acetylneuraminic acid mutarotase